ncbi:hypothetical protein Acr_10g0005450 [Actinidia rufa]|uniref:Uncharacterized protein n=1 Tax=Actinidia rufa TaxID=165716 RepID=A0A7J0F8W5_9ERIC|nr:hypothetical protein Acr_10g0005450 [Actinidia rufa]
MRKAQKKAQNLDAELKNTREELVSIEVVLVEECKFSTNVAALTLEQELNTPLDRPAWTTAKPPAALLDPPKLYLPILLPGCSEEEYANQAIEEDDDDDGDGGAEVAKLAEKVVEARTIIDRAEEGL